MLPRLNPRSVCFVRKIMNTSRPKPRQAKPATIDEYLAGFPAEVQRALQEVRNTIKAAVPEATQTINYSIPTFTLHGNLVHFAAFKHHLGFYPTPSGIEHFKEQLSAYEGAKGSVKFPLDQPLPLDLIREIVLFRAKENRSRAGAGV